MKLGERHVESYVFDGRRYRVDEVYPFGQLPKGAQRDARRQDDDIRAHYGVPATAAYYHFVIVPHDELVSALQRRFGESRYAVMLEDPSVIALAREIERHGLQQPPVLEEGWRRALAIAYLGWDLPYFTIDEPIEMPTYADMPTLDGRRTRR